MTLDRFRVSQKTDLDPRGEAGTYYRLDDVASQSYSTFPLAHLGRRNPHTKQEIGSSAFVTDIEAVFCVWDFELGFTPKLHDRILDANGITWSIRDVSDHIMNTRYHVTCIRIFNL